MSFFNRKKKSPKVSVPPESIKSKVERIFGSVFEIRVFTTHLQGDTVLFEPAPHSSQSTDQFVENAYKLANELHVRSVHHSDKIVMFIFSNIEDANEFRKIWIDL